MVAGKTGRKVLVTGGGGFIGSYLCDELLRRDYMVTCVDNFITGNPDNIKDAMGHPDFSLEEKDVTDTLDYEVDYIFSLASPASPVDYANMPIKTMLANAVGTKNCLGLARKLGCECS